MCGLTGVWHATPLPRAEAEARVVRMRDTLVHRGPDAAATWHDEAAGLSLGHRRLAIVDLSPEGLQPMASASGRYVVAYNGEVYNYEALRAQLPGVAWRGHSDTEVMLAAIEAWGLRVALDRIVGMFAITLWDREERVLSLVRDRLGIKPMYVGETGDGALVFGSELSALAAHPGFARDVDREVVAAYLRYGNVPAPHCIYRRARKLRPGTVLTFRAPRLDAGREEVFWDARAVAEAGLADPFRGDEEDASRELEALLADSVRLRMIADVPLGAFLSGGIDSSAVVALMQAQSTRKVRTFSIGNETADYDEGAAAGAVAKHLGTEHTGLVVRAQDAVELVPDLVARLDEPFADSSLLPTFLVSKLAREHVTVALSGDGGDELFGGYNRHVWLPLVWRATGRAPKLARSAAARALGGVPRETWDAVFGLAGPLAPKVRLPGDKLHKLARTLGAASPEALYEVLCAQWQDPLAVALGARREAPAPVPSLPSADLATRTMLADLARYLPDDILTKVDRASMQVALEARVPILDHRVVAFAFRLPVEMKIRRRVGKLVLRRVLHRHVPRALVERPKMGFGVPVGAWLRGPLREWGESLLDARALRDEGLLDATVVRKAWDEHQAGKGDWVSPLWTVLALRAWTERARA